MHLSKTTVSRFLLIVIFLFSGNVFADSHSETFSKKVPFQPEGLVSVKNINGNVEITSWDRDEVEVTAHKSVYGIGQKSVQQALDEIEIRVELTDDELLIETIYPDRHDEKFFSWLFGGKNNSFSVRYEIQVPRRVNLNIRTTNGNVEAERITGRVRLESTNGKVIGTEISGPARCRTTNGSIDVSLIDIKDPDDMSFYTTNGSISLELPKNFGGFVDLKTTNGHVDCDFPMEVDDRHKRTLLRGKIGEGDADITCSTTNGSIHIRPID